MKYKLTFFFLVFFIKANSQKVDSIYFHLYTDSLKKGTHNYINVDGLLSNGRYIPLDSSQIAFSCNTGTWEGNDLVIDSSFKGDSVLVTATLKGEPKISRTISIHIKKKADNGPLKTEADLLKEH
jgi:hypothetical protein